MSCYPVGYSKSSIEGEVFGFLQSIDGSFEKNRRSVFKENHHLEIDAYSEKWKLGIESYLRSLLGHFSQRVFARKCEVREICNDAYKDFCESNHIQGSVPASVKLGLLYDGELVEIMSFTKPRLSKHYEWELARECSKGSMQIVGGKSKLFAYFVSHYKPQSIVSYCEKRLFTGASYKKLGYHFVFTTTACFRDKEVDKEVYVSNYKIILIYFANGFLAKTKRKISVLAKKAAKNNSNVLDDIISDYSDYGKWQAI